jgi:hypothetical protein
MTKWGGPSDETRKTEAPCHSRYGTIKIPPCSNALSAVLLNIVNPYIGVNFDVGVFYVNLAFY